MKLLYKVLAAAAGILALSSCVEDAVAPLTGKYEKPVEYVMTELKSQSVEKGEKTRTFTVELAGDNASLNMKFVGDKYYLHDAAFTAAPADAAKVGNYIVGNGGSTFTLGGNTVNVDSGSLTVAQVDGKYTFNGNLWLADESVVKVNATVALVYEADPEPVVLSNVLSATSNVASGTNSVTLSLAQEGLSSTMDPTTYQTIWTGEGKYLALDLYSADGYLHEGTYTASAAGGAIGEGEFGIGWDPGDLWGIGMVFSDWGTCWWTVSGGVATAQKITEGTVTVTKKGAGWVIELVSGEGKDMIWAKFTGNIEALTEPADGPVDDTEYTELVTLISATSNVANGTPSLTLNMATDGVTATYDAATWSTVYAGTGNYLALDIYSADGKLYTGTYNAGATAGTVAEGEFGIGWDPGDLWGIGMIFENWGTCWWAVDNGATSAEKVVDGTVEVAVEGANLVIKLKSTLINARFTYPTADFKDGTGNPIEVVNLGGGAPAEPGVEYTELVTLVSATSNVANGTPSLTLNMATDGVTATYDAATWSTVYAGSGNYLALDIYSADGKLRTGTYNAGATAGTVADGEFGIGWDPGDLWGIGMIFENWGTCWWTVDNGATSAEKVVDGTVKVSVDGANLVIALESTLVNARFTYPAADFKDGQGNAIEVL